MYRKSLLEVGLRNGSRKRLKQAPEQGKNLYAMQAIAMNMLGVTPASSPRLNLASSSNSFEAGLRIYSLKRTDFEKLSLSI